MRFITEHIVNPANDRLKITVVDAPTHGGANHAYRIEGFDPATNPAYEQLADAQLDIGTMNPWTGIAFQNGPIDEDGNGVNGVTHEALLAIVADRLRGFQKGPYACKENACALTHIEEAQHWLQQRTLARMRRGVEGTHVV